MIRTKYSLFVHTVIQPLYASLMSHEGVYRGKYMGPQRLQKAEVEVKYQETHMGRTRSVQFRCAGTSLPMYSLFLKEHLWICNKCLQCAPPPQCFSLAHGKHVNKGLACLLTDDPLENTWERVNHTENKVLTHATQPHPAPNMAFKQTPPASTH